MVKLYQLAMDNDKVSSERLVQMVGFFYMYVKSVHVRLVYTCNRIAIALMKVGCNIADVHVHELHVYITGDSHVFIYVQYRILAIRSSDF